MASNIPFYPLLASLAVAVILLYLFHLRKRTLQSSPLTPLTEKHTTSFKRYTPLEIATLGRFPDYSTLSGVPPPKPYPNFNIATAKPRPYRPFRWAYHQTMSLSKLDPDFWIELENTYPSRLAQRHRLYETHGTNIIDYLPGPSPSDAERLALACRELMEMVVQFLIMRYPHYFSLNEAETVFYNGILNKRFELDRMDPLMVVFENVPEDFIVMMDDADDGVEGKGKGEYFCRAGVVCSSIGWCLGEKIGRGLGEIHGGVPYMERIGGSMARYFKKLPPNKPIQRGSWDLVIGQPLFELPGPELTELKSKQSPNLKEEDITLRVDWQTLRRLPLSGAIVFNYKALFTPLSELADEPGVPAILEKVLKEGDKVILEYKGVWHVEHIALPMLERMKKGQEERGLWEESRGVRTLQETPFFRGWEEKWRRQQGF
ncbi:hypothetical protein TWF694_002619 [Orbilia ellipsospora]|uniref:Uncharacterized protein n=1 Tax=Orbilia ellipsospora TaxID=2528407 RepID=A0AAV9X3S0_9PEZI